MLHQVQGTMVLIDYGQIRSLAINFKQHQLRVVILITF